MPRGRKPDGDTALSNADRQARYHARLQTRPSSVKIIRSRPANRRSRARRWRDAVTELLALQAEYAAWADALPDSLREGTTADALQAIVELNLDAIAAIEPPRGYGRD
jgi:hypothetical protein